MFLPLVDMLRCPKSHEESWLVASIDETNERDIVRGTLGCPVCLAEYSIREGVVYFAENVSRPQFRAPSDDEATLLAAALDLTDARMTAVLQGAWDVNAPLIRGLSPSQLVLVNPPAGIASGDGISIVCAESAPFAAGSVSAAAFDASASQSMIDTLTRAIRSGGRLLAPVQSKIPADFSEIARNQEVWIAQSGATATSAPVTLRRGRG